MTDYSRLPTLSLPVTLVQITKIFNSPPPKLNGTTATPTSATFNKPYRGTLGALQ